MKCNINWENFYERFKWEIEDSRPYRRKCEDENIPSRYYTIDLERLTQPAYTKCYRTNDNQCLYMSKDKCNCTNDNVIGYGIKHKSLSEIKIKDCPIIIERMHKKNVNEYLNSIKMPFGKFKGRTIYDILLGADFDNLYYLFWLWQQGWCKGELKRALDVVRLEFDNRWKRYIHSTMGGNFSPWDDCPFSLYNEVGYGDLC